MMYQCWNSLLESRLALRMKNHMRNLVGLLVGWLVGWLVSCIEDLRRFSGILAISRLGSRDYQSLKSDWRGWESNPGPLTPQAKSLTTRPSPLAIWGASVGISYNLWYENATCRRRRNIATQEQNVCNVEIEGVAFVVNRYVQLIIPTDREH